jgi:hypothetical protein
MTPVSPSTLFPSQAQFPPEPWIPYSCQRPRLNQTGELNAPTWFTRRCESSASNVSALALPAK